MSDSNPSDGDVTEVSGVSDAMGATGAQDTVAAAPDDIVDVAVIGGGAAGLTLALHLREQRPGTRIVVLERQAHPVPEAAHKVGESTVEIAGYYLREVLGLGRHLQSQQLNKYGLRVFFSKDGNDDITRRVELGHSVRPSGAVGTYQLDRGRLENALGRELAERGVRFLSGAKVEALDLLPGDGHHRLRVRTDDGATRQFQARWVVDATGRASLLKRRLGLAKKVGHRANAVWFRVGCPIDVDQWSDDPQWHARIEEGRRELSTNHLMGPGYWVWLIRLASGSTSVGIVTDPDLHPFEQLNRFERALEWLDAHEPQCAGVIRRDLDKIQDFRVMKDYAYSCEQVFSEDRWCLAGEAGVFLDPLYSPGLDLIAISNGLITDLITHALDGEDIQERAAIHNQVFLLIADGWLSVYESQYALMGNARVMLAKVIWDTAVYWAAPGLLYFHDALRHLGDRPDMVTGLARFSTAGRDVQRFFREWAAVDDEPRDQTPFVRFYDFDFMSRLHIGMTAGLADAELSAQFAANILFVEHLSGQLVATVLEEFEAEPWNAAKQEQARRWRADEALMALVGIHLRERDAMPLSDQWIRLRPAGEAVGTGEVR
ncbi:NAD(P)/FAD-dependent oxidoreductase [Streptomyces yaizuensis]|uniref:FAD-dependent monooxygenase n=1 Tax=Streptomyces yaizuensis TaxID=2989713 RepID=A0ABQ5NRN7_9ACTN|nr:NAD(P)/FAD-dependent oxidoreductase [Streptomyces sp. YSPA8]GLF93017.1 FAD-dependent monooxygenase [Streptomyces sp. YSPA8]